MPSHNLSDLPGPTPEAILAAIGVRSRADLTAQGAVRVFVASRCSGRTVCLNVLRALGADAHEGAQQ